MSEHEFFESLSGEEVDLLEVSDPQLHAEYMTWLYLNIK